MGINTFAIRKLKKMTCVYNYFVYIHYTCGYHCILFICHIEHTKPGTGNYLKLVENTKNARVYVYHYGILQIKFIFSRSRIFNFYCS